MIVSEVREKVRKVLRQQGKLQEEWHEKLKDINEKLREAEKYFEEQRKRTGKRKRRI